MPSCITKQRVAFTLLLSVALAAVGISVYAFVAYFTMTPGSTVHPDMKEVYSKRPLPILFHVGAGLAALSLGALQFFPEIRANAKFHRLVGYGYFGSVLISAIAGLVMASLSYGGRPAHAGFAVLGILWLGTMGLSLFEAMRGNISAHKMWVTRNYALTYAAVILRIQLGILLGAGVPFDIMYPIVSWTSWVFNVPFVDYVLPRIVQYLYGDVKRGGVQAVVVAAPQQPSSASSHLSFQRQDETL